MSNPPTITILLLGDPACGKSTFFSNLRRGSNSTLQQPPQPQPQPPLPLHDLDQPFTWQLTLYNRPYLLSFYDTASPTHYTLLEPDFVILCYDISCRLSLNNLRKIWFPRMVEAYMRDRDDVPVMVLGLKRDLREEKAGVIYPQEGLRVAQDLRCDRYAECSAATGELMNEVIEDIARTAAKSTTEKGGLSSGGCSVM